MRKYRISFGIRMKLLKEIRKELMLKEKAKLKQQKEVDENFPKQEVPMVEEHLVSRPLPVTEDTPITIKESISVSPVERAIQHLRNKARG